MKTVKRISFILLLGVLMPIFSSNLKGEELPEVVVTCSAGNYGSCFDEYCDWFEYDSVFKFKCKWTGSPQTYCSLLFVKTCNILLDYIM
jgi:hypothetical protein